MPKNVFEENIVSRVRDQLGDHNDPKQPVEWCVQDMRLSSERLKKTVAEAKQEIAVTNNLIAAQRITIEKQKKQLEKYELIY